MLFHLCNVLIISFLKQVVKRTNTNFYYKTFYIILTKNTEINYRNQIHFIIQDVISFLKSLKVTNEIPRVNVFGSFTS